MSEVSVINAIEVPKEMEAIAVEIRNRYVDYFKTKPGFVSSTFYKALDEASAYTYINIVVWASRQAFEAVVNSGFEDAEGKTVMG